MVILVRFCALTARLALAARAIGLADRRVPYTRKRGATRARLPSRVARTGTDSITCVVIGGSWVEPPRRGEANDSGSEPQITQKAQIVMVAL